jgi:hypothetical protein
VKSIRLISILLAAPLILWSCGSSEGLVEDSGLERSSVDMGDLLSSVPDYRDELQTIEGSGRAIVSEPGNNERVTLEFFSNRSESLINVKTSVGIEGGSIHVNSDSILVYNRVDKQADRLPIQRGNLSSVGSIATVNILDLFNYTVVPELVDNVFEDSEEFILELLNGAMVHISKDDRQIVKVDQRGGSPNAPYSLIEYSGYGEIEGFTLPRRITIYSRDEKSRAVLLVQRLEVNEELPDLSIDIPDDVIVNSR